MYAVNYKWRSGALERLLFITAGCRKLSTGYETAVITMNCNEDSAQRYTLVCATGCQINKTRSARMHRKYEK